MEQDDLISHLRWVLERQLHWISAADVKAGGMIGAYMALAAIAATLLDSASPPTMAKLLFVIAGLTMIPALAFAVAVFFPRVDAIRSSCIYFGEIAQQDATKFLARRQSKAEITDDLLGQIFINAQIATCKHKFAKISILLGAASLAVWIGAVATFVGAA